MQATRQVKNGLRKSANPTSDLGLDLYKDAGGHNEAVEGLDSAVIRFNDVDDALVSADLELLAALLVDERRTKDGVDLSARWQRHRAGNVRARALCVIHDFPCRRVKRLVVVGFHSDSNLAALHGCICPQSSFVIVPITAQHVAGHMWLERRESGRIPKLGKLSTPLFTQPMITSLARPSLTSFTRNG